MKQFKRVMATLLCLVMTLGLFAGLTLPASAATTYNKVTSAPSDWSGDYLVVYQATENATSGVAWTGVDAKQCRTTVSISNGVISTVPSDAVTITVATMTGGYSIKVNGGSNNGKYIYGTNNSNKTNFGTTATLNTFAYDSTNKCVNITSNTSVMRYNAAANTGEWFRYFKSSSYTNQKGIQLYKATTGGGTTYSITYDVNGGTPSSYTAGSTNTGSYTIPAANTPSKSGYAFAGWSDGTNTYQAGDTITGISADVTLTAQWTPTYTLSVSSVAGGTITATPAGGSAVAEGSNAQVTAGTNVTLTATPDSHYSFTGWSITGNPTVTNNVFAMPAAATTVSATFTQSSQYTATMHYYSGATATTLNLGGIYSSEAISTSSSYSSMPTGTVSYNGETYSIVGWLRGSGMANPSNTAPGSLISTSAIGNETITANTDFYAVYAAGGPGNTMSKITSLSQLTNGAEVALRSVNGNMLLTTSGGSSGQASADSITYDASYAWTVGGSSGNYTLSVTSNNTTNYLGYPSSLSNNTDISVGTTDSHTWSIIASPDTNNSSCWFVKPSSNSSYGLEYNASSNYQKYVLYAIGSTSSYKYYNTDIYVRDVSYSDYRTDFAPLYTVTSATAGGGTGTVTFKDSTDTNVIASPASLPAGTTIYLHANATSGTFASWSDGGAGGTFDSTTSADTTYVTPAGAATITATFNAPVYSFTAQSNNTSYGTVSTNGNVITASPTNGYRVSTSTPYTVTPANSATVSQNGNAFTVSNVTANCTVRINFEAIPTHTVTMFATPENGTVAISASPVREGTEVTLTIHPDAGYRLASISATNATLSGSGVADGDTRTFTMGTADVVVTATFEAIPTYTITYSVNGNTSTLTADTVEQGQTLAALKDYDGAIPSGAQTYTEFVGWTTAAITTETDSAPTILPAGNPYTPTGDVTLYAVFTRTAGGGAVTYSPAASLDTSTEYVIGFVVNGSVYPLDVTEASGSYMALSSISLSDGKVPANNVTDDIVWTLVTSSSAYKLRSKTSSDTEVRLTGSNTGSNTSFGTGTSGSNFYMTSAGDSLFYFRHTSTTGARMVLYNTNRVRFYTAESGGITGFVSDELTFFAKSGGGTTYYVTYVAPLTTYTLAFSGNTDDASLASVPANIGPQASSSFTVPAGPTRTNYEFVSWNTAVDGTGDNYAAGATYTMSAYGTDTLYAQWRGKAHTVTYYDKGVELTAQNVNGHYGDTITLPAHDTDTISYTLEGVETNFTFAYWAVVPTAIEDPTATAPTTTYAPGATFTLTEDVVIRGVYTYTAGGEASYRLMTAGSSDLADGDQIIVAINDNGTYYAIPNANNNAGTLTGGELTLTDGAVTVANAASYYFTLDGSDTSFDLCSPAGSYYLHVNKDTLKVVGSSMPTTFTRNGATFRLSKTGAEYYVVCSEHVFDSEDSSTNAADLNIFRYTTSETKYLTEPGTTWRYVTFNSNGGSAVAMQRVADGGTATAPSPAPTREGYTFVEWQLNGSRYDFTSAVSANITLDAVWRFNVTVTNDVVLLGYDSVATIDVLANDVVPDGTTISLVSAVTGFSVADNKIVFTPSAISGGFKSEQTATYQVTVDGTNYTATVKVKPAELMYYEDSNTGVFSYTNGNRGVWETVGDEIETAQAVSLVGEDGSFRTADGGDTASLTYSGGQAHKVNVGTTPVNNGASSTWPYVEFTFAGTGFEAISVTSNTTGVIMYEVHQGDSVSGTLVGKRTIVDTYQGASYNSSTGEWSATGNTATYYQIPIVKVTGLDYGTYTVRISASYGAAYDHAGAGSYDLYFDGVRIFNPVEGDTAAYLYRSFRDAVTTANSIGVVPEGSAVAATFYVDGVANTSLAQSVSADESITLPTLTDSDLSSFDGHTYHFYGWLAGTDLDNDTDTAPTTNFYAGGATYQMGSTDVNFYAVAYYTEGTGTGNYAKVTSSSDIGEGDYLIVFEDAGVIMNGASVEDSASGNCVSATIESNTISYESYDEYRFTAEAVTGGYMLKGADGNYIYSTSASNGININSNSAYADDYPLTLAATSPNITASSTTVFAYQTSGARARFYKSGTASGSGYEYAVLYKKTGSATPWYATDLLEIIPTGVTLSGTATLNGTAQTVTNGAEITMQVGESITVTATVASELRKSTSVYFSSSPSGIVTMGGSGMSRSINGSSVGTTTITVVCAGDTSKRASFTVNVVASSARYAYTVNLYENSTAVTGLSTTGEETGTYTFTLPSSVTAANTPSGYTFAGWVAAEFTGNNSYSGTSAGLTTATGYIAPGGEYTMDGVANGTATATLYALYTKSESVSASSNATYQMVTSDSFSTSDTYVLAALKDSRFYFVNGNDTGGSLGVETQGLANTSLTGNTTFVASSLPAGAQELKVTAASGAKGIYYTVHDEDLDADVNYSLYATASAQSLAWSSTDTTETFTPNFTQNSDTDGCVLTGSSGSKVSYNSAVSDYTKFIRNYASTGLFYTDLYFFKYVAGSGSGYVTNYYFTTGASTNTGGETGGEEGRGLTKEQVTALYTSDSSSITVGGESKTGFANWGSRGEWATFLTSKADSYYTGTYAIDVLMNNEGGSTQTNACSSDLFSVLQAMLNSKHSGKYNNYDAAKPILGLADCVESDRTKISAIYDGELIANNSGSLAWTREHTWPHSKDIDSNNKTDSNDSNDAMMLRAEGSDTNGGRGNKAYGKSSGYYYPNLTSTYDVRGDVARIIIYQYVHYYASGNGIDTNMWGSSGVFESLDVMYEWMVADPVDTWEMGRNDVIQQFTGVRNPFVDYPELFFALFGYDIPANYHTPSGTYATATSPSSAFSSQSTPAAGENVTTPVAGNAIGIGTETRGVNRNVADGNLTDFEGAAVMVNGMGAVTNVSDFLTYGPKNELYLAEGNAIVVYVSGRASEVAVGAKALNGSATGLSVYKINGNDSLTSVLTGATENVVSVASASERFYPINVSAIYDSGTHAERSTVLLIYNPNSNPVSLTSLRVNSASNATLAVSTGTVTRAIHAVRGLRNGTAIITEPEGGNDTPIIPIENPVAVLTSANLSLDGLIGVNFYVTVPSSLVNSGCYFTVNGEKADLVKVDGASTAYRVTGRVAAKEMNDTVELKFYTKNGSEKTFGQGSKDSMVSSYSYSVAQYLEAIAADAGSYSDTLLTLVKAMSAYGSYAQTYFKYGTGVAVDEATAAAINAVAISADEYTYTYSANTANIKYYGESVVTESETAIRFYFTLGGSIGDYTVTVNGEAGQLVKAGKYYYVEVSNIAAKDLGKGNTVTVTYGGESLTIDGYSVYTYVKKQLSNTDANLVNAVKALKYYGDCAAAYFAEEGNN